ncbi:MAG: hypothetical protein NTZ65_04505 [Candidatus Berkelbacteria bacterium]|nr:hypothetical protein [Candidatus Berkelbacteria bacterium]
MAENKTCKQCGQEFVVSDDDLAFLEKISPVLNGRVYKIDAPKLCYTCRQIRRLCWRNERSLYKRKCDKTGEEIVSVYSPDKPYKVYKNSVWRSDDWDPMSFGREFDFNQSFFEQFNELLLAVPRQANNTTIVENSNFCNQTWQTKDSYLCFNAGYAERCYYCTETFYTKDCIDCFDIRNCEYCYHCFDCDHCHNSMYLEHCENCSESYFSYDCRGCNNVLLCAGLHNKQYCIENKEYSEEEYKKKLKEIDFGRRSVVEEYKKRSGEGMLKAIHKENNNVKTENCTGDYLIECKDCKKCFNAYKSQNCVRITNIDADSKDCRDLDYITEAELCYDGTSNAGYKNRFSVWTAYGDSNLYCNFIDYCSNCFGCIGINHKQHCILNKQYTKEEYDKLVPKIIERMQKDGEWGEFCPMKMSLFGYNETMANIYHPKTKAEAEKIGGKWQDKEYNPDYKGEAYEPKDSIDDYINSDEEVKKLLAGVLKCEKSGKPFKIMPQELAFYIRQRIPVPTKHSEVRYKELFKLRNPRVLYHRQCMCDLPGHDHSGHCPNEFETTYAPERPEKVYCESCYQKEVI